MRKKTLKAELKNLAGFMALIKSFCEEHKLDDVKLQQVELSLEEVLVNVIKYAYPEDEKGDISLICDTDRKNKSIVFQIIDSGMEFDSLKKKDPDVNLPVEERQIGGLGIYLVKKMMDDVKYKREKGKNHLILRKDL